MEESPVKSVQEMNVEDVEKIVLRESNEKDKDNKGKWGQNEGEESPIRPIIFEPKLKQMKIIEDLAAA